MEKAFMDPVHGFILIREAWLLDLIACPEVQRLRRIRQLGASAGTYPGAEHTRFGHALGALHVMNLVCDRLAQLQTNLDEREVVVARAAALLHDVGHAPFSHALEARLTPRVGHETWTVRILTGDTEVHRVLAGVDPALPAEVAAVLAGGSRPGWVPSLVASQLDVDRMDYLLRDAQFTGARYGRFDLERIVNTLTVRDGRVVLLNKGLHAAEEYVLARHFMYWRVYLHKTTRGQEALLWAALRRAQAQHRAGRLQPPRALAVLWEGDPDVAAYLQVDDHDVMAALKEWAGNPDPVLADLARRFLQRDLLKPLLKTAGEVPPAAVARVREAVAEAGWDPEWYCLVDEVSDLPYDRYTADGARGGILIEDGKGEVREISELSPLVRSLAGRRLTALNIYVPEACRERARRLLTT